MLRFWKKAMLLLLAAVCLTAFPVQAEEKAQGECPEYCFLCTDGSEITAAENAGKTTLIAFVHMNSNHSDTDELIQNLLGAYWSADPRLSIIVADCTGKSPEQVREYAEPYGQQASDISFCAEQDDLLFRFMEAAGLSTNSFSFPMCFVVDPSGKIQASMMGEYSETALRNLLAPYVQSIDPVPTAALPISGEAVYSEAFKIVELINAQRAEKNLPPVTMDKSLLDAAMLRAAECSIYYSHTRPDGTRCFTAIPNKSGSSGENIAIGQQSGEKVMEDWMNSQGHRANILNEN